MKVRYDKEACQGKRNDIIAEIARLEGKEVLENSDTGSKKMHTRDRIGKAYDLSGSSVARLIKLNDLDGQGKRNVYYIHLTMVWFVT